MSTAVLPHQFKDLAPFADWVLPTETERHAMRQSRSMDDISAFYDAALSRAEAIFGYLNGYPLDAMSEETTNLLNLTRSWIEVAPAVENYHKQNVPGGFDMTRVINSEGMRFSVHG